MATTKTKTGSKSNKATKIDNDNAGKLPVEANDFVLDLYSTMKEEGSITMSVEYLAYTDQFELLYNEVQERYPDCARRWLFRKLASLRKQGKGKTRIRKPTTEEFKLTPAQIRALKALYDAYPGGLSRAALADKADIPLSMEGIVGAVNMDDVENTDKELGKRTLRGRKYVRTEYEYDSRDKRVITYLITEEGIKALNDRKNTVQKAIGASNTATNVDSGSVSRDGNDGEEVDETDSQTGEEG